MGHWIPQTTFWATETVRRPPTEHHADGFPGGRAAFYPRDAAAGPRRGVFRRVASSAERPVGALAFVLRGGAGLRVSCLARRLRPCRHEAGKGSLLFRCVERFSQASLSASPVPTIQLSPAQRKTEPPQPVYSGRRGVTVTRADALGPLGGHGLAVRPPAVLQRTEVPTPPRRERLSRSVPEAVPAFGQRSRARRLEKRASSTGRMTFRANVLCVYRKLERTLPTQRRKDVSGNLELVQRACQEKNRYVVSITRFQSTSGSVIDVRHNTPILSTVG